MHSASEIRESAELMYYEVSERPHTCQYLFSPKIHVKITEWAKDAKGPDWRVGLWGKLLQVGYCVQLNFKRILPMCIVRDTF